MAVPAHQVSGPPHLLWYLSVCGISKNLILWKEKREPKHISSNEQLRRPASATPTPRADVGMAHMSWTEQVSVQRDITTHTTSQKSLNICVSSVLLCWQRLLRYDAMILLAQKVARLLWAAPNAVFLRQIPASLGNNTTKISKTGFSTTEKSRVCIWRPWWHLLCLLWQTGMTDWLIVLSDCTDTV